MREVTISSAERKASVLIDGEAFELPVPIRCRAVMSEVQFLVKRD